MDIWSCNIVKTLLGISVIEIKDKKVFKDFSSVAYSWLDCAVDSKLWSSEIT
jgi:hypothetical protein